MGLNSKNTDREAACCSEFETCAMVIVLGSKRERMEAKMIYWSCEVSLNERLRCHGHPERIDYEDAQMGSVQNRWWREQLMSACRPKKVWQKRCLLTCVCWELTVRSPVTK